MKLSIFSGYYQFKLANGLSWSSLNQPRIGIYPRVDILIFKNTFFPGLVLVFNVQANMPKKKGKGKKKKGKKKKQKAEVDPNSAEGRKANLVELVSAFDFLHIVNT